MSGEKRGHPLWRHDRRHLRGHKALVGVDEAGRGALAGPVVAAAVVMDDRFYLHPRCRRVSRMIRDSKLMSPAERESAYALLHEWVQVGLLRYSWSQASVSEIEHYNILGATRLAMERALRALQETLPVPGEDIPVLGVKPDSGPRPRILVDGCPLHPFPYLHQAIVGGDRQSLAIAAASIVAKVERDRSMCKLDAAWPAYGFARHKGYGTRLHRGALLQQGPCPQHRMSFLHRILIKDEPVAVQACLNFEPR